MCFLPKLLPREGLWDGSERAGEWRGCLRLGRAFEDNHPAISRAPLAPIVGCQVLGMFGQRRVLASEDHKSEGSWLPRWPGLPVYRHLANPFSSLFSKELSSAYSVPGTALSYFAYVTSCSPPGPYEAGNDFIHASQMRTRKLREVMCGPLGWEVMTYPRSHS